MAEGLGAGPTTDLVVVATNAADVDALMSWLSRQAPERLAHACSGFYPGMAALARGAGIVVIDVGTDMGRECWRLAELRDRAASATVVVIADAMLLPSFGGALHADLAVTGVDGLPPLRELLVSAEPELDQTSRRRSTR